VKRIAAAVIFFSAAQLAASGVRAGSPDPSQFGRPSSAAPDTREPQATAAAPDAAADLVAINEGFELVNAWGISNVTMQGGGMFANGWIRQNNSDMPNGYWTQCLPTSQFGAWNAADGPDDSCALSSYGSTQQDGGTISDWIVSPQVNFGTGSAISFHTRTKSGSQYPDRLQVRICTSGPCTNFGTKAEDVGDFTTLLLDINPGETTGVFPEDWTRYTLGFADGVPTTGSGRIAFRYYVHQSGQNGSRGNLVGLDRVIVATGEDTASPLEFSATVAPADASNPNACGPATSVDVTVGDQVNYCYKVTNHSQDTLNYQYLRDDRGHSILTGHPATLAPGDSYQYNRIVTIGESQSPSSTWTAQAGPWGYAYAVSPQPASFIDITDGTPISIAWHGASPVLQFPPDFDFRLYGESINQYCVLDQGIFESVKQFCASNFFFSHLPNDYFIGNPTIAPFWVNVGSSPDARFYQKTIGTAPNRQFIVEWKDVETLFNGPITMEVILNETSNTIEYRYAADYGGFAQGYATGLQNQYIANLYPDNGSLDDVGRLLWTPADPTAYTATRKTTINAGVPSLAVNVTGLGASAPSHGTSATDFSIGNSGSGRLDWSLKTAAATNLRALPQTVSPIGNPAATSFGRPEGAISQAKPSRALSSPAGAPYAYAVDLAQGPYLWHFDPNDIEGSPQIAGYMPGNSTITGATFLDDDFTKLYVFDTANNQLLWLDVTRQYASSNVVGVAAVPTDAVTGIKQDPTTGTVYLSTADGQSSGLWTIDPATAAVRQIGNSTDAPGIIDIAFDAQGNLYGVDIVNDALVAIDKSTGAAQPIGSIGFDANCAAGLAFDFATDTLYFTSLTSCVVGSEALYSIDTTTGLATMISPIGGIDGQGGAVWDALAIAHPADNVCTDPANVPWLSLTPANGSVQAGTNAANVHAVFNGSGLADGTYSADLCMYSNDPLRRHGNLPVTFTVGGTDRIFADGFDGSH